jgi:hypothetical protein
VPEKTSVSIMEGGNVELKCALLYGAEENQKIKWTWQEDDTPIVKTDWINIENDNILHTTKLILRQVSLTQRGVYDCIAENKYGNASQSIVLRVRGK